METRFFVPTDELVVGKHENYKSYLTVKKKSANQADARLNKQIKQVRKRIKEQEKRLKEYIVARNLYKKEEKDVNTEYTFRKKIVALQKKHNFLDVWWEGDADLYTTWVYSNHCDENNPDDDIFYDQHFHDSYQDAYHACLDYIDDFKKKSDKFNKKEELWNFIIYKM